MMGLATLGTLLVGSLWVAETTFGFRIEEAAPLYLFDYATRQSAGVVLIGVGIVLAWWETHTLKSRHRWL